jgi:hypothetical protein
MIFRAGMRVVCVWNAGDIRAAVAQHTMEFGFPPPRPLPANGAVYAVTGVTA